MKLVTFLSPATKLPTVGALLLPIGSATVRGRRPLHPRLPLHARSHRGRPQRPRSRKRSLAIVARVPLTEVTLLAPIPRPPRVFAIGLNYQKHAAESNMAVQKVPTVFMKLSSSVVGPDVPIILPTASTQPDYEAEFAFVISKPGYQIPAADWQQYVFGYTICNDVSARDIQLSTSQWTLGKSFPTFCPLGPSITTADEVPDPHHLNISLTINGETLQSSNTSDLIFKIPELIAYISSTTPLEAGDIISTGTPEGVGLGRTPRNAGSNPTKK